MINLLPYEQKKELKAAHTNSMLIRYVTFLIFAFGFLLLVCLGAYLILTTIKITNDKITEDQSSSQTVSSTLQTKINDANSSITAAESIIGQEKLYSSLLTNLGSILPAGSKIDSISIDDTTSAINLTIRANSTNLISTIENSFTSSQAFYQYKLASSTSDNTDVDGYSTVIKATVMANWEML